MATVQVGFKVSLDLARTVTDADGTNCELVNWSQVSSGKKGKKEWDKCIKLAKDANVSGFYEESENQIVVRKSLSLLALALAHALARVLLCALNIN